MSSSRIATNGALSTLDSVQISALAGWTERNRSNLDRSSTLSMIAGHIQRRNITGAAPGSLSSSMDTMSPPCDPQGEVLIAQFLRVLRKPDDALTSEEISLLMRVAGVNGISVCA